ncbi:MAG TPA: 2OG-Fe(II) oxygenase [Gemmatimonadaceae bacterium]|nr:2OG-Fe(II) oxygenase [Gemmatimonadaceae bacterium]
MTIADVHMTSINTTDRETRVRTMDWDGISTALDARGWTTLPALLSGAECGATAGLYDHADGFRSHVIMGRHGFGRGDFEGGEFVLTEQRPRMQTRAAVVPLGKGDAAVFAVNSRPVKGVRGDYRVNLRHGVSALRSGRRHTLGVIFHAA